MRRILILMLSSSLVAGCGFGEGIGSWRDATFGLAADSGSGALERVLEGAEATPGNQGLLYVAMVEAEVAAQSASQAVALSGSPALVTTALGELIYAVRPEAAPDWDAKTTGLVPGWRGLGYGMIRASSEMLAALQAAGTAGGGAAEAARAAAVCAENTVRLGERTLELAKSLLAGVSSEEEAALLPQLERLASGQLKGVDVDGDGAIALGSEECALQQVLTILEPLRYRERATAS